MTLVMLLSYSIGIIFLEARLYSVGSTVFGLTSVASLFIGMVMYVQICQKSGRICFVIPRCKLVTYNLSFHFCDIFVCTQDIMNFQVGKDTFEMHLRYRYH